MRLSLWPEVGTGWPEIAAVARFADAGGWHALYVEDHFFDASNPAEPLHEVTATIAALAALTERVRLATLVLSVTHRHPAVIANWATTVDHISGGRFTLGIGAGWSEPEHGAYGLPLGTPGERVHRFAEAVEVIDGLLHEERTTLHGRWFDVTDATAPPHPVQPRMPLLIGAKGNRMLGLTARFADEWNAWSSPESLRERMAALDHACERHDRDPATVHRSTQALVLVSDDASRVAEVRSEHDGARPVLAGTAAEVADQLGAYARVGADEFIVPTFLMGSGAELEDALGALWSAAGQAGLLDA
jgi:alkanesulfonate monooxygenase SsuD/methylene tetrahydromethanopterin reductase-like flavin-dependent oxidoreductase (luciferase family)